ncbi:MAG: hypothetical protein U9R08_04935 [Nanoarchaeota archaeon]|nr:hypothetical protein [Nanoarchaeota archaeon]
MNKIKQYVKRVSSILDLKKTRIESMLNSYVQLMSMSDSEIRRVENHSKYSQNVDISKLSDPYKNALESRSLQGMTQQQFMAKFYQIEHFGKEVDQTAQITPQLKNSSKTSQTARVISSLKRSSKVDKDIVNSRTAEYFQKFAEDHALNVDQAQEVVLIMDNYKTNFTEIEKIIKRGYNLNEVREFYEAREVLTMHGFDWESESYSTNNVKLSLDILIQFHERFFPNGEVESSELIDVAEEIFEEEYSRRSFMKRRKRKTSINDALSIFLETAKKFVDPTGFTEQLDYQTILEFSKQESEERSLRFHERYEMELLEKARDEVRFRNSDEFFIFEKKKRYPFIGKSLRIDKRYMPVVINEKIYKLDENQHQR